MGLNITLMSYCGMVDFGIDAFWLSHEPWLVPQPFTPEAGEMLVSDGAVAPPAGALAPTRHPGGLPHRRGRLPDGGSRHRG